ncbi:MAG: porphobilinogen synthase [Thermomicrobiales bacterium]
MSQSGGALPDFRRYRRLRQSEGLRRFARETILHPGDFVYPLFVTFGRGVRREVSSMPDVFQLSIDQLEREANVLLDLGIGSVILFGIPEVKDLDASDAYDPDGVVQQAIRELKRIAPNLVVIGDVCCCEYTSHGHCGILDGEIVDNDRTLALLARTAVAQAQAGVDIVAPSDMMDGRVRVIREALDEAGYVNLPVLSYSAKYASGFYGPFRDAADSTPEFGDRRSHQMDPANVREAYLEIAADIDEGADAIIVKPAMPYLDVIAGARERFDVPIAAYNVSGEYAMVRAAGRAGWIDERRVTMELLTSIRRAGASQIITYHAKSAAGWLREEYGATLTARSSPVVGVSQGTPAGGVQSD